MHQTRRDFVKLAALGLSGSLVGPGPGGRVVPPSDRIRVGLIGCRGRGYHVLRHHLRLPDVELVALADVDRRVLDERVADAEALAGRKPDAYSDYRALLDDASIDAVIIGTPDHWHALNTIDALEAGKDVYVEKPMANSVVECDAMVAAAKRYDGVMQVGQQQRSSKHWHEALSYAVSGALGKIRRVEAWAHSGSFLPAKPDEAVPEGVDYDMWLGPAPDRPFNINRFHGNWRWFWDYGGGLMTDWGVHLLDMVLLAMEVEAPRSVAAVGGVYSPSNSAIEPPDTLDALYDFGDFTVSWQSGKGFNIGRYGRHHGVAFIGDDARLVVDRHTWEVVPHFEDGEARAEAVATREADDDEQLAHVADFIEAVKTRGKTVCGPEVGRQVSLNAHLGNIAYRTGRRLHWDHARGRFENDPEADAMLGVSYRDPWQLASR